MFTQAHQLKSLRLALLAGRLGAGSADWSRALRRQIPEKGRAANMAAERGARQQQSQEMMEGERPLRVAGE